MKQLFAILLFACIAAGCGDDNNPADAGGVKVVDETFTVSAGAFRPFSFSVNTDTQLNAYIQGEFEVTDGSIDFAIMGESAYQAWQAGQTPNVLVGTGVTPRYSFRLNLEDTDTYYIVFSNVQQTGTRTVKAQIYLFSSSEEL